MNLYRFYLSKCPETVKNQNNMFYLQPEESCAWDSPVWFSAERVNRSTLEEILTRLQLNERTIEISSPSSNRNLDETESSDEAADAKNKKASITYSSVNMKEGESLIAVRRRVEKQLKQDLILFDFWYENHQVEDGNTMEDLNVHHKSAKISLQIQETSSGGRLEIVGFFENLFVGESESEDEDEAEVVTKMNSDKSEDTMSDTELLAPRSTLSEDEARIQEIDGEITVKMEELASASRELAALHQERMKISGKMRRDGQGGGRKKKQMTAVVQEAEDEDAVQEEEDAVQEEEDGKVKVFCAGFCINNGKPEARAGVGVYWGQADARNKSCRVRGIKQTTRTAEVQAATMAIQEATRNMISGLQVNTDKFVFTSVTEDMKKWKQKGWRSARGKDLKNKNDWQELDQQLQTAEENNVNIEWKLWTGGEGKNEATNLATEGAHLNN